MQNKSLFLNLNLPPLGMVLRLMQRKRATSIQSSVSQIALNTTSVTNALSMIVAFIALKIRG